MDDLLNAIGNGLMIMMILTISMSAAYAIGVMVQAVLDKVRT